ncbi:hypothetical protein [Rhizobacter sp. Root1221]|uniref:hypothetical protein n=1 Tax=Rhizobacter sp. Root1221 TaxID=1736433 RepID=UPI0006FB0744|nr:hypothetical protein [Rhizobacter sp. Root1221]KQV85461.1 hypothetical protein ASC87_07155 [Rhizobacter sp. Root1221]
MTPSQLATLDAAAESLGLNVGGQLAADVRALAAAARIDAAPVAMLKRVRNELHACQAVIHLAGGFDPRYVADAKAALKELDAAIALKEPS